MTALLALDLATRTGFAFWQEGMDEPAHGSFKLPDCSLPGGDTDVGKLLCDFEDWLILMRSRFHYDTVVFEAARVDSGGKRADGSEYRGKTSIKVAQILINLAGHSEFWFRRNGIKYFQEAPPSWRKTFTGKGTWPKKQAKPATERACRSIGWFPKDDNAADALGILYHSATRLKLKHDWGVPHGLPLPRGR